ncbi:MAG: glutamyl-tRNA reductase [Bacteroidota bacterium]
MMNTYKILTVTHRTSKVNKIGDFVIKYKQQEQLETALSNLKDSFQLEELMYLATCNRVLFLFKTSSAISPQFQYRFFRKVNENLDAQQIEKSVLSYEGQEAIAHFCSVAASIDSMVIGEREILRQVRLAYEQSREWGLTGDDIRIAVELAVQASKDVYSNTRIGEKPVSVASLAVQQLRNSGLPRKSRILLIGAGSTNMLISKFLHKYKYSNVTIFNRTLEKAEKLAEYLGGSALPLEDLSQYSNGFDCMIVCTGATQAIITPELYAQLLAGETDEKLVIDIAIPNNVDKAILNQYPLDYVEVETIRNLAKENLDFRKTEVHKANLILNKYLTTFPATFKRRRIERAMKSVPQEIKAVKSHAMNNVFKQEVEALDEDARELVEKMLAYMEKKCIGIPMKAAKNAMIE